MKTIKEKHQKSLLSKKNVVSIGIGYKIIDGKKINKKVITVGVIKKVEPHLLTLSDLIPKEIEGVETDVIETGLIKALSVDPTERFRPAPGGVSIGHKDISAGTLGVVIRVNEKLLILSNNHVLANSNNALIGDAIYQPGTYDGGTLDDLIATLYKFVPINFEGENGNGCPVANFFISIANTITTILGRKTRLQSYQVVEYNKVDAALAEPLNESDVITSILEIGEVEGTLEATLDLPIRKFGRTTKYTENQVTQTDVTVRVNYSGGRMATFTDQIIAGVMGAGGDSGSLIVELDGNRAVGLLFAGSETTTVINRIEAVFAALEI